jgi:tetratricopeptide (TPR) repeat protein
MLFLDRAQAARPDFTLTERNRESLESLCQKLDGVPLALELAASRIRSLSVSEMQSQLSESLRLLARPNKNTRHSSLHAAIDWSWRMLSPSQQHFLAQLSVFRGSWSVEAASAITELSDTQERLDALADASLVVQEETPAGQTRFRLLELIRAFAGEQLTEHARDAIQERHRTHYATQRLESPDEEANFLAALESACAARDSLCAYSLFLTHATTALAHLGTPTALALGQRVLSLPAPTPREKLVTLSHTAAFADTCGDTKLAQAQAQEALTLAGSEPELRAIALSIQGQLAVSNYASPTTVIPLLREALELSTQCNDTSTRATVLRRLGILLLRQEELAEAATCFEISEALFIAVRDLSGARYALANRAHVLGQQGDSEASLALYNICLERAKKEGDPVHQSKLLLNIGSLQAELGQWKEALESGQACSRVCQRIGNLRTLAFAFWNLPEPLLHLGRPETAALLMAFAETFWLARFGALGDDDNAYRDKILEGSHATAGQRATGSALSLTDALALALS